MLNELTTNELIHLRNMHNNQQRHALAADLHKSWTESNSKSYIVVVEYIDEYSRTQNLETINKFINDKKIYMSGEFMSSYYVYKNSTTRQN